MIMTSARPAENAGRNWYEMCGSEPGLRSFRMRNSSIFSHCWLKHACPENKNKRCNEFCQNWLDPFLKEMQKIQSWMSSPDMKRDLDFMAVRSVYFVHSIFDFQQLDHILVRIQHWQSKKHQCCNFHNISET